MPATLVAEHVAQVVPSAPAVSVDGLSNSERMVALYASDMPVRYRWRREDADLVISWILQGAARLGLGELYRSAAYAYGYRMLCLVKWATPEHEAAHARRFPSAARLNRAEDAAVNITCIRGMGMTQEAKDRGRHIMVEGGCPCSGTGWVAVEWADGEYASQACPLHNPGGSTYRPGVSL
ncbi:hypothetical protein [Streptomyces sp. NPDC047070]|uniref:hypothetical protein n=1 Tax=Streptomyces sp. NPDC047070 TaxID=3154923 RepID=UPI003452470B